MARAPTGETMLEVQARWMCCLLELRDLHGADEEIVLIGHGDPIRATLAYCLGMPIDLFTRIEIDCGSISTVRLTVDDVTVQRVNFMP